MTFIIAEAGINHGGDYNKAVRLANMAAAGGADAVKFQAFTPVVLEPPGSRRDLLADCYLLPSVLRSLKEHCDMLGVEFMATPFDAGWVRSLVDIGIKRVKIGSGNLDNTPLLEAADVTGLPVIVSTGGTDMEGVSVPIPRERLTFMHCTSAYPCPLGDVNLRVLTRGYRALSIHAPVPALGIAAAAMGAEYVEAHLCLSRKDEGPDIASSMIPEEFAQMVGGIRAVEAAMGDGVKRVMPSETGALKVFEERKKWRER